MADAAPRAVVALLRDVLSPGFQGSRADLEAAVGRRLEVALALVFLAARVVHLGQAAVDLGLAQGAYTRPWLADLTGVACLVESAVVAAAVVRRGRLTLPVMLADAAFGVVGLAALSAATTTAPGRVAPLNWMLQYTVATAAGLGLVAQGRLLPAEGGDPGGRSRPWVPAAATAALAAAYVASTLLPHVVPGEDRGSVADNVANYAVFFLAAVLASAALRRVLAALRRRNAEVAATASAVAQAAQWRAVVVDVFGPVLHLLDEVAGAEGSPPAGVQEEAGRLIELIESVRPTGG